MLLAQSTDLKPVARPQDCCNWRMAPQFGNVTCGTGRINDGIAGGCSWLHLTNIHVRCGDLNVCRHCLCKRQSLAEYGYAHSISSCILLPIRGLGAAAQFRAKCIC